MFKRATQHIQDWWYKYGWLIMVTIWIVGFAILTNPWYPIWRTGQ